MASEQGGAQTVKACLSGVVGPLLEIYINLNDLERLAAAGDSPVGGNCIGRVVS